MSKRSQNPVSYVDLPVPTSLEGSAAELYSVLEGLCGDLEVSYRLLPPPPVGGGGAAGSLPDQPQASSQLEARFIGRKWSLSALLASYCGGDLESAASLSGLVKPTHTLRPSRHSEALHAGDVADFQDAEAV